MATVRVTRPVNVSQFAAENPGHPIEMTSDELTAPDMTAAALAAALAAHTADADWTDPDGPPPVEPEPTLVERLAAVEAEVRGMRERAAALAVTGGAASVRDAITGPAR